MRNITLAIDDDVLAKARRRAAEKGTTVNAVVREHLKTFAADDDVRARARRELLDMAERSTLDFGADWVWNREDAYAERSFPRHQRPSVRGERDDEGPGEGSSGA